MLREITIGQYYPTKSRIHVLDPRTKILCTLLFLISLFLFRSISGFIIATAFLILMIGSSKVPVSFMFKGLKTIFILLFITVLFNLFLTQGTTLVKIGIFTITEEGVRSAVYMAIRLVYLIIGASVMTLTTTPNALTDGIESLLKPLTVIHVPVHEIAMMMSIALRFIPILIEETDKIMKAQIARGANLDNGNLMQKARAMVPILVPLFVSAFRRAGDLAMAMESRCYHGGTHRTRMKPLAYRKCDWYAYGITVFYVLLVVAVGRLLPLHIWIF